VEQSAHLIDLIRIVFKWRKPVAVFFCGVVVVALAYCLVTPNEYTARATLMPGSTSGEMSATQSLAGSFLNQIPFLRGFRSQTLNPAEVFANTLSSRLLARRVVRELNLIEVFRIDEDDPEKALEMATNRLLERSSVDVSDMMLISIEVTWKDPELAAAAANRFLNELDKANQEFSLSSAKNAREFVEDRLGRTEEELREAQGKLMQFQSRHGAIVLDEQSKATVEAVAALEAEILAMEARRDALSATHTPSYSKVRELDLNIEAMRKKVRGLMGSGPVSETPAGAGADSAGGGRSLNPDDGVFIPLGDVPEIAAEYARLLLDVKTQEQVFGLLIQQHEQLEIEEAKDVPTIQILDRAFPPIKKSGPQRKLIVLLAAITGFVGAVALALIMNYLEAELDQSKREELIGMRKNVLEEIFSILPWRRRPKGSGPGS
jgi:uncharacterized protein involved in exopolysaccharide biosynthesis